MPVKPLLPEGALIWSSRGAVLVAAICALLALLGALTDTRALGVPGSTYLLAGIGAMLYGIWAVVLAIYFFRTTER